MLSTSIHFLNTNQQYNLSSGITVPELQHKEVCNYNAPYSLFPGVEWLLISSSICRSTSSMLMIRIFGLKRNEGESCLYSIITSCVYDKCKVFIGKHVTITNVSRVPENGLKSWQIYLVSYTSTLAAVLTTRCVVLLFNADVRGYTGTSRGR